MPELYELLRERALKTVAFFESKLKDDGSYGADIRDLSCYFKSPMMFIYANKNALANQMLSYLRKEFMTTSGDFETRSLLKSVKPEYSEYWSYTNGWIVRAAQQLHRNDIVELGHNFLKQFNVGTNAGFLTGTLQNSNGETDVLTAAHQGLINLENGNTQVALSAGNYLCEALDKQPELGTVFYLRFNSDKNPIMDFKDEKAVFYRIKKGSPDQLYFMIGYPSAYLALLYKTTKNEKYLQAAKSYLNFALTCDGVLTCNFSHKIAWASSIIYGLTGEEQYLMPVQEITSHFLKFQSKDGLWYQDSDLNTSYDQSAEIACWLLDISNNLKQCKKKLDRDMRKSTSKQFSPWTGGAAKYGVVALIAGIGLYAVYRRLSGSGGCESIELRNQPSL